VQDAGDELVIYVRFEFRLLGEPSGLRQKRGNDRLENHRPPEGGWTVPITVDHSQPDLIADKWVYAVIYGYADERGGRHPHEDRMALS